MRTKNANCGPPKDLGSVEVNSAAVLLHMWIPSEEDTPEAGSRLKVQGILCNYNLLCLALSARAERTVETFSSGTFARKGNPETTRNPMPLSFM